MSKEFGINMTVGNLKEIIKDLDDDMYVILPIVDPDNYNKIDTFAHVRTVGVLNGADEKPEEKKVLCIATSENGIDMHSLINLHHDKTITCEKMLF